MAYFQKRINIKQISPNTYNVSYHPDWRVGITLFGGCVAAQIHHALATHVVQDPTIKSLNQPDIMTLHIEFPRPCELQDSTISINPLKTGKLACTLQAHVHQGGKLKVVALATITNFDKSLGPSIASPWKLNPPPLPKPDFKQVLAGKPDENWLPSHHAGDLAPVTGKLLALRPRTDYPVQGFTDGWNTFVGGERMDASYLASLADFIPSMSHSFLGTGSAQDYNAYSAKDSMSAKTLDSTIAISFQFKRRLAAEGQEWTYTRVDTKMMEKGRMDVAVSVFNEEFELLCTCQHMTLVLESSRKFGATSQKACL
ncbi:thioesterase family protein [Metarhizium guizhouense ARSEF 977]|uniref:Thioesterase family protein n=1 Tax=Metarhizium guizhouense (strain ARSEF 977) TaxID=1276136 RepID=A0A0B4HYP9_METGA|nr:thioesterase family protein [Metarhizium guizhouense ARSEF 977]